MKRFLLRVVGVWLALGALVYARAEGNNPGSTGRERLSFDHGWKFHFGHVTDPAKDFNFGNGEDLQKVGGAGDGADPTKAAKTSGPGSLRFDDSAWKPVTLPHDWAVALPFDERAGKNQGYKPLGRAFPDTSVGWYRRVFNVPPSDLGRRIVVEFDGVFRDAHVWINGCRIAHHESGYTGFSADLTDYLNYGIDNVLLVRVDATQSEGWFYEGAGIYRHVWLTKTAPLHIVRDGVQVLTDIRDHSSAEVTANIELIAESDHAGAPCGMESVIRDGKGREVARSVSAGVVLLPWQTTTHTQRFTVTAPQLWSPESPALYTLVTTLRSEGAITDVVETTFGFRTLRFDPEQGFFLNGKHVLIKGVCCHQDHAGVGVAVPDALQDFRIARLREMGANAYRSSHNAPTAEILDACDRLGMLVMNENREPGSNPAALARMAALVRRDRNRPSVFMWSIANEEKFIQGNDTGARIGAAMKRTVRALDPSRPVTAAMNGGHGKGFSEIVDVEGFNYFEHHIDAFHQAHPRQPMIGAETASAIATRGIYSTDKERVFIADLGGEKVRWGKTPEEWWTFYAARPFLAGGFVWTGFDYRGEPTPYAWPAISSQFGILDTCGFPKDGYYYYRAWWRDEPSLHLAPHWNWTDREGQAIDVRCFTNCDEVELFLNGRSLGRQPVKPQSSLSWKVPYEPGALSAKGFRAGREILSVKNETTGAPAKIVLVPDRSNLRADGEDLAVVTVAIQDAAGRTVPLTDNLVSFEVSPNGRIIGVGNGNPGSHEADQANQRHAFNGLCQVIVQTTPQSGPLLLTAKASGLESATLTLNAAAAPLRPAVPVVMSAVTTTVD
jgi:beta-galactosidase